MKSLDVDKLKAVTKGEDGPHGPGQEERRWPSREPQSDADQAEKEPVDQLNIRGPKSVIERFKALRIHHRQPYYEVLEELLDRLDAPR